MKKIMLNIEGMACEECENRIKNSVGAIEGIKEVKASHVNGTVEILAEENVNAEIIKEKINDIGFKVKD